MGDEFPFAVAIPDRHLRSFYIDYPVFEGLCGTVRPHLEEDFYEWSNWHVAPYDLRALMDGAIIIGAEARFPTAAAALLFKMRWC